MRNSPFRRPILVLIFGPNQKLLAVAHSLHCAAEVTGGNLQSISFCCTGKYASSGGLYFRHRHPAVEIKFSDLGKLQLKEYDKKCGEEGRTYYSQSKMLEKRALINQKKKNQENQEGKNEQDNNSKKIW